MVSLPIGSDLIGFLDRQYQRPNERNHDFPSPQHGQPHPGQLRLPEGRSNRHQWQLHSHGKVQQRLPNIPPPPDERLARDEGRVRPPPDQ